jgi:beta-glucanase (GH16 family)
VKVQKGYLALRTEKKNDTIYSAMIGTQNRFETTFGYFEVRCLLPQEEGHWAAFWLQTPSMGEYIVKPEKAGAEIDIFEFLPNKPKQIHHTLHYDGYGPHHKIKHKLVKNRKFEASEWHTFALEWTPTHYVYFIDGEEKFRVKKGISHRDQYIILSLEVGDWAGDIRKANLPDFFIVDYVRVYKQKSHSN